MRDNCYNHQHFNRQIQINSNKLLEFQPSTEQ